MVQVTESLEITGYYLNHPDILYHLDVWYIPMGKCSELLTLYFKYLGDQVHFITAKCY